MLCAQEIDCVAATRILSPTPTRNSKKRPSLCACLHTPQAAVQQSVHAPLGSARLGDEGVHAKLSRCMTRAMLILYLARTASSLYTWYIYILASLYVCIARFSVRIHTIRVSSSRKILLQKETRRTNYIVNGFKKKKIYIDDVNPVRLLLARTYVVRVCI